MTEPEQWAVELWRKACHDYGGASIEDTPAEWRAVMAIQRAFEERERKLREENQRLMIAAAATIQGGMDEYKRGNADGVKAGIESGLEQAARIARAAQYSKSPATDTLRGIGDLLARQALKETPDAQ